MRSPHWEARRGLLTIQFLPCPANTFPAEPTFPNHHPLQYPFCPIWVKLKKKEFMGIYGTRAGATWSHRGLARKWNSFCPNLHYIGGQQTRCFVEQNS